MDRGGTTSKGMSIERWIFYEGLKLGLCDTLQEYYDLLPDKGTTMRRTTFEISFSLIFGRSDKLDGI